MTKTALGLALAAACACGNDASDARIERAPSDEVRIDRAAPVVGVPDRGRDPAVIALHVDDGQAPPRRCAGVLVRADVVLTSRSCLAETPVACPLEADAPALVAPELVTVSLGDDPDREAPAARGRRLVVADDSFCAANTAVLVLDRPIPSLRPLLVRTHGVASGDFVRTVGFLSSDDAVLSRIFRDHVRVGPVSSSDVAIFEACATVGGGVALDDDTGEIVGVLSAVGPECGSDSRNTYARVDALGPQLDEAEAQAKIPPTADAGSDAAGDADAGRIRASDLRRPGKSKPPTDIGGACERGADCASGVCVGAHEKTYCSRGCGTRDRCPSGYQCRRGVPFGDAGANAELYACVRR